MSPYGPCPIPIGLGQPSVLPTLGDLRHDMHVNIVTFQPPSHSSFAETHVMEHGLDVIQARDYLLNRDCGFR